MQTLLLYVLVIAAVDLVRGTDLTKLIGGSFNNFVKGNTGNRPPPASFARPARSNPEMSPALWQECVSLPYLSELKDRFTNWYDPNGDGKADLGEMEEFLHRVNPNIGTDFVKAYMNRRDTDGSGSFDLIPEYVKTMLNHDSSLDGAIEDFTLNDRDGDKFVTVPELMQAAQALGMSDRDALQGLLSYYMPADANNDEKLSFDEFKKLYVM